MALIYTHSSFCSSFPPVTHRLKLMLKLSEFKAPWLTEDWESAWGLADKGLIFQGLSTVQSLLEYEYLLQLFHDMEVHNINPALFKYFTEECHWIAICFYCFIQFLDCITHTFAQKHKCACGCKSQAFSETSIASTHWAAPDFQFWASSSRHQSATSAAVMWNICGLLKKGRGGWSLEYWVDVHFWFFSEAVRMAIKNKM